MVGQRYDIYLWHTCKSVTAVYSKESQKSKRNE